MMNVVAKLEIIFSNRKWERMELPSKVNTFHDLILRTLKPAYNGIPEDILFRFKQTSHQNKYFQIKIRTA
jgi:hypothetical protein